MPRIGAKSHLFGPPLGAVKEHGLKSNPMDQVKIETQEESLPAIVPNSSETLSSQDSFIKSEPVTVQEWDASMELALLNAVARCKPVGKVEQFKKVRKRIHPRLRVQKTFNQQSPVHCSIKEIWNRLSDYYGMEALDELEEGEEEEEEEEEEEAAGEEAGLRKQSWLREFSLPLDEYEQLISEHRQDDQSSVHDDSPASPVNPPKRTRTSKRDTSPSVSLGSAASTPEPEEGRSSRRASRGARKSDATPEPVTGRGSRKPARTTRGSRRQTKRK